MLLFSLGFVLGFVFFVFVVAVGWIMGAFEVARLPDKVSKEWRRRNINARDSGYNGDAR